MNPNFEKRDVANERHPTYTIIVPGANNEHERSRPAQEPPETGGAAITRRLEEQEGAGVESSSFPVEKKLSRDPSLSEGKLSEEQAAVKPRSFPDKVPFKNESSVPEEKLDQEVTSDRTKVPLKKLSRDPSALKETLKASRDPSVAVPVRPSPSTTDKVTTKGPDLTDNADRNNGSTKPSTTVPPIGRSAMATNRDSTLMKSRATVISFRTIAEDKSVDGSFFTLQNRTLQVDDSDREVPEFSLIRQASKFSTVPLASDNDEFFQGEKGYRDILQTADAKMQVLQEKSKVRQARSEVTMLGALWRWCLKVFLLWTNDHINRLKFTRGLQEWLPFQTVYETILLAGVIRNWDTKGNSQELKLALRNRNVSRTILQNMRSGRYDRLWHWNTQVTWNRWFDLLSQFPFLGGLSFAATENFPSTKNFAIRAIVRTLGAEGYWITRLLTGNLQGLVVHAGVETPAQNLAAESNDFEQLNRDQHGSYFGRQKTNAFRLEHRLTTDESIVRTFMSRPASTMVNNGVEHVLRCVAKHWHNMLFQENGNFAHQRMEQLDPFTILRFHMPIVLVTLANLRGRNVFDSTTLGPFIRQLEEFDPSKARADDNHEDFHEESGVSAEQQSIRAACEMARELVNRLQHDIVYSVCAGVPSRLTPLRSWLSGIEGALAEIEVEAVEVLKLVKRVENGVALGHHILGLTDWHLASDAALQKEIMRYIKNPGKESNIAPSSCIYRAMEHLAPKDRRTLQELIQRKHQSCSPCKMLLGRTLTLVKRELWRKKLDDRIREFSRGGPVASNSLVKHRWYWVGHTDAVSQEKTWRVCIFSQRSRATKRLRFIDADINMPVTFDHGKTEILMYIPIAEAISRAQKVFMTIELDHGKKFSYNAFMEFGGAPMESSLRARLRRLATIAQLQCSELDKARLNTLTETKKSTKAHAHCKPQNVIVVGGGPTGLLMAIHCAQNVLLSGGEVRIYEDRDAFAKEAATYERAQIVRLDSRQVAMLRYHLGTSYEDIFVPASGETDPHLGNSIPSQGFVEVTIKRLEYMLQEEILRLNSKGLVHFFAQSHINVDSANGIVTKAGKSLKENDNVFIEGREGIWRVKEFLFEEQLRKEDMVVGMEYDICPRGDDKVYKFKLDTMDIDLDHFHFAAQERKIHDISGRFDRLPPIYLSGKGRTDPSSVVFESIAGFQSVLKAMSYDDVVKKQFRLNIADSHIIVAAGKPKDKNVTIRELVAGKKYDLISREDGTTRRFLLDQVSKNLDFYAFTSQESGVADVYGTFEELPAIYPAGSTHFQVTTAEPYAVCCIEGLKVSMGMHSFGQQRWGSGLLDDIRSVNDQNTRIVGDFTKSVALIPCVDRMIKKLNQDKIWRTHFDQLPDGYECGENVVSNIAESLLQEIAAMKSRGFRRVRLQTRFFELGMNYYLGMELAREFDKMKNDSVKRLVKDARKHALADTKRAVRHLRGALMSSIDRLWYEATLEVIAEGDVYNPGGRASIPQLKTIDSPLEDSLGNLGYGEAFVFARRPWVVTGTSGHLTMARLESADREFSFPSDTPVTELKRRSKSTLRKLTKNDRFEPLASFEILFKTRVYSVVRNTAGNVVKLPNEVRVHRISDLSRGPDGYSESKVSLASFPVAHIVANRTLKLNVKTAKDQDGYMMAFVGDGQASPHFMRYSGLTGACINCMSFNNMVAQAVAGIGFKSQVQRYALETNWSNGEVVQRGTGANYGEDGFLRPGFTHTALVDYLFEKAQEYEETETELSILSRDWKNKIAAALVPRGLENDILFLSSMIAELRSTLKQKYEDQLRVEYAVDVLTPDKMDTINRDIDHYVDILGGGTLTVGNFSSKTSKYIKCVVDALAAAINYSAELRQDNKRISSEMFTQPNPVDSIVDDFAVEAQNFANSLTQSVAFAVIAISLQRWDQAVSNIASLLFGILSIGFAFGTITNVSRYKNRNEEVRRAFFNTKLSKVEKAVFSLMSRDKREMMGFSDNPFASEIDAAVQHFVEKASYYGVSDSALKGFSHSYAELKQSINDDGAAAKFERKIVEEFIPVTFHFNSYLQEALVGIYKSCHEIRVGRSSGNQESAGNADRILKMLSDFKPQLEASLESEAINFGFFKRRKMSQWAVVVTIRYFLSCLYPYFPSIGRRTKIILNSMKAINPTSGHDHLFRRAQIEVRTLYYATTESEVASAVLLSGFLVFLTSIVFTVFRIISFAFTNDPSWVADLVNATGWAVVLSSFGAILALLHFFRKTKHLIRLFGLLEAKYNAAEIDRIRWVTFNQIILTLIRIATNITAVAALPCFLVTRMFLTGEGEDPAAWPVYLALLSALLAICSVAIFFFVEFWVRYQLDPALGRKIFELFQSKIEPIKQSLGPRSTETDIDTKQNLERETWEYTAREFLHEYRFDTVFAADRFGSILQYLQSQYLDSKSGST